MCVLCVLWLCLCEVGMGWDGGAGAGGRQSGRPGRVPRAPPRKLAWTSSRRQKGTPPISTCAMLRFTCGRGRCGGAQGWEQQKGGPPVADAHPQTIRPALVAMQAAAASAAASAAAPAAALPAQHSTAQQAAQPTSSCSTSLAWMCVRNSTATCSAGCSPLQAGGGQAGGEARQPRHGASARAGRDGPTLQQKRGAWVPARAATTLQHACHAAAPARQAVPCAPGQGALDLGGQEAGLLLAVLQHMHLQGGRDGWGGARCMRAEAADASGLCEGGRPGMHARKQPTTARRRLARRRAGGRGSPLHTRLYLVPRRPPGAQARALPVLVGGDDVLRCGHDAGAGAVVVTQVAHLCGCVGVCVRGGAGRAQGVRGRARAGSRGQGREGGGQGAASTLQSQPAGRWEPPSPPTRHRHDSHPHAATAVATLLHGAPPHPAAHLRAREVAGKGARHVAHVRPPPAVDGLIRVTHHKQVALRAGGQAGG